MRVLGIDPGTAIVGYGDEGESDEPESGAPGEASA